MAQGNGDNSHRPSGSRRTRSQLDSEWTVKDALILVNEIAAVEADCLKALSTYQKWKIIAENCTAQEVTRTSNQCKRKWDSLFLDYSRIKQWVESQSEPASYWWLGIEKRIEFGLPEDFDDDLYTAIDDVVRAQTIQPDTDPEAEILEEVNESGAATNSDSCKLTKGEVEEHSQVFMARHKTEMQPSGGSQRSKRQKQHIAAEINSAVVENQSALLANEEPLDIYVEEKPLKYLAEDNPLKNNVEEDSLRSPTDEKPLQSLIKKKLQKGSAVGKKTLSIEENDKVMAMILRENAERIHSIVTGSAACEAAEVKIEEGHPNEEFVRRQGDMLITCLGNVVKTLDKLSDLS